MGLANTGAVRELGEVGERCNDGPHSSVYIHNSKLDMWSVPAPHGKILKIFQYLNYDFVRRENPSFNMLSFELSPRLEL